VVVGCLTGGLLTLLRSLNSRLLIVDVFCGVESCGNKVLFLDLFGDSTESPSSGYRSYDCVLSLVKLLNTGFYCRDILLENIEE